MPPWLSHSVPRKYNYKTAQS